MSVSALPCQTCLVSPVVVSSVCKNLQRSHQAILQLAIAQLEEHETATVTPKPKTAPATYSTTSAAVSDGSSVAATSPVPLLASSSSLAGFVLPCRLPRDRKKEVRNVWNRSRLGALNDSTVESQEDKPSLNKRRKQA